MMLMTGEAYRESLRALSPRVFVNGHRVESVADTRSRIATMRRTIREGRI